MKTNRFTSALTAGLLGLGLVAAVAPSAGAVAPAVRAATSAKTFKVTLKASRDSLEAKGKLVLRGTARPAVKGGTVKIQKKLEGKPGWKLEKKVTMGSTGRFSYTDHPSTAGVRRYRAVVPAQRHIKAGRSTPTKVTVYRWLDLGKVKTRSQSYTWRDGDIAINGVPFATGIAGLTYGYATEGFMDWNLDRRCTKLTVRVGNGDESDDAATATISLVKDGDTAYTKSFGLTESEKRTLDLTGVFRFKFAWTSTNPDHDPDAQGGAQAVMVLPKVRCAF